MTTLSEALANRPINWDDMGSSERDLWEERITRSWHRFHPAPAPGTIGIGVGHLLPGIPSRGEPAEVFHSQVWFPTEERETAAEFAADSGLVLRDGIAL